MKTKPAHAENALDQVAFALVFGTAFTTDVIAALGKLDEVLGERFSAYTPIDVFHMNFQGLEPYSRLVGGHVFETEKQSNLRGHPEWSVRIEPESIVIICRRFSDWNSVWSEVKGFFTAILASADFDQFSLKEVALQCADLFELDEINRYDISEVFDLDSKFLTRHIIDAGSSWHLHQGWFANIGLPEDYSFVLALHNLNVSAALTIDNLHTTVIDHNIRIKKKDNGFFNVDTELLSADSPLSLDNIMRLGYDHNKTVVGELLSLSMREKIGMKK